MAPIAPIASIPGGRLERLLTAKESTAYTARQAKSPASPDRRFEGAHAALWQALAIDL
jgi:hypothetical protein